MYFGILVLYFSILYVVFKNNFIFLFSCFHFFFWLVPLLLLCLSVPWHLVALASRPCAVPLLSWPSAVPSGYLACAPLPSFPCVWFSYVAGSLRLPEPCGHGVACRSRLFTCDGSQTAPAAEVRLSSLF
jgi:hypothetical protein